MIQSKSKEVLRFFPWFTADFLLSLCLQAPYSGSVLSEGSFALRRRNENLAVLKLFLKVETRKRRRCSCIVGILSPPPFRSFYADFTKSSNFCSACVVKKKKETLKGNVFLLLIMVVFLFLNRCMFSPCVVNYTYGLRFSCSLLFRMGKGLWKTIIGGNRELSVKPRLRAQTMHTIVTLGGREEVVLTYCCFIDTVIGLRKWNNPIQGSAATNPHGFQSQLRASYLQGPFKPPSRWKAESLGKCENHLSWHPEGKGWWQPACRARAECRIDGLSLYSSSRTAGPNGVFQLSEPKIICHDGDGKMPSQRLTSQKKKNIPV